MEQILTQICGELNNWFTDRNAGAAYGTYEIKNGTLPLDHITEGQCVRIVGSIFNDGVHMYPFYDLQDETFTGAVMPMRIPPEVMQIAAEVQRIEAEGGNTSVSPYTSESFGGYSYTRATDSNGVPLSDMSLLVNQRLEKWRKMP